MSRPRVRVRSRRTVPCEVCEGTGFVYAEWFAGRPLLWSETECPVCEGTGRVPEVLEEIAGPEAFPEPLGTEVQAEWVRAYREARRQGLSPEAASRAADAEVWGFEELPF